MKKLKLLDLFSGIGGFSLGLESTGGFETVAFCEFDKHAREVLKKHWPDKLIYEDVRTLDAKKYRGSVDVVCGGFPCQDVALAGKKEGITKGERSNLYTEMLRIIGECLPQYAIFENVTGLLTGDSGRWFAKFLYDLAEVGYDAEWHCIPASQFGANHHRDRVWIIAYPSSERRTKMVLQNLPGNDREENERWTSINAGPLGGACSWEDWEIKSGIQLVIDGIPRGIHRLKQLSNSIVPAIPKIIGEAILKYESAS